MTNLEQILKLQKMADKELLQHFENSDEHTFEECCEIGRRVEMNNKIATSHGNDFELSVNEAVEKLKKQIKDKERREFIEQNYMQQYMVIQKVTNKTVYESMLGVNRLDGNELLKVYDYYKEYAQDIEKRAKEDTEHKEVLEKIYNQLLIDSNKIAEEIKKRG